MAVSPSRRLTVLVAAIGLAMAVSACRSGDAPAAAPATATAGRAGSRAAVVSTAPARAIGQAQAGAIPVWLTSFAVMPWTDRVDAGRHTFTVSNRSAQPHSFAIIRFDGDPRSLPRSSNLIAEGQVEIVAETDVIDPGREVDLVVDLAAGRYVLTSLFAQDYTDGMAAGFSVGGTSPGVAQPKQPPEGALGMYLLEYGAFASSNQVSSGNTRITVQNLGTRAREFALVRWRGAEDALPTSDGLVLIDGLQEVHRFDAVFAGEARELDLELRSGFAYVLVSLTKGEYEKGIHAQIKVN